MSLFEKFARKYFEEAALDLARARRAFEAGDYPQAVFYAQQCVEKGAKAMLEAKRRVVLNHGPELISAFVEAFESEWSPKLDDVVGALEYLMEYYTRARYPFVLRGEVVSPSEIVTREVAERGLYLAERALKAVGEYLRRRGIVGGEEAARG
jgi:HEPN domain-containing protein